jgi:hypothetical protein
MTEQDLSDPHNVPSASEEAVAESAGFEAEPTDVTVREARWEIHVTAPNGAEGQLSIEGDDPEAAIQFCKDFIRGVSEADEPKIKQPGPPAIQERKQAGKRG